MYNRGCEAILRSTVAILRAEFGACRFVHCPGGWTYEREYHEPDPDIKHLPPPKIKRLSYPWFVRQFRRRVLPRFNEPSWYPRIIEPFEKHLPETLATLALGGDNYSLDYGDPLKYFHFNMTTLRQNRPLIIWGASVGPFNRRPRIERMAAEQLKRITLICARESESVAYLDSLGIRDNVRLVADPAFALESEPVELSGPERLLLTEECIGLNVSPLMGKYWQGAQSWPESATACVRRLLEEFEQPIVLVPHVIYPRSNDHAFMTRILEQLPQFKQRLILIDPTYNCQQLKWIISKLGMFIGARTHATIAALSSHVPTLSIGYSMKSRGINQDIFGHLDWLMPLDSLRPAALLEVVKKMQHERGAVHQHLTEMMPAYQERSRLAAKYLKEVVS